MNRLPALVFGMILVLFACGGDQPGEEVTTDENGEATEFNETEDFVLQDADYHMTVSDSIGVEYGDSNYVIGLVTDVDFLPDGRIAVLDGQSSCVRIYSPEGEFIARLGRRGSGPGEFLSPMALACFPGGEATTESDSTQPGLVVADAMGAKLVYFDRNLNYLTDVQPFIPSPPVRMIAVNYGAIVGMKPEQEQRDGGMFVGTTIARWSFGALEPSTEYFRNLSLFNPADLSSMQEENSLSFGASPDGIVVTAPVSTDTYSFTAVTPAGEEIFTVTDDSFERVQKTQEEIDIETEVVNNNMRQMGMDPNFINWEPNPYRPSISGLAIDGHNRIWVTRGTVRVGTFDVYDLEGNLLYTVALDAGERAENLIVLIKEDRFIAYDENPEDFPQVFVGDLPLPEGE